MSHPRTGIRKACVEALANNTAAGANVFSNQALPIFSIPLPALNVIVHEESSAPENITDDPEVRTLTLAIDIYVSALTADAESADDTMDDIALVIEGLMDPTDALGEDAVSSILTRTMIDLASNGETQIGVARLIYEVTYIA